MRRIMFCVLAILPIMLAAQVTEEWVARYNGPVSGRDVPSGIAVDSDGNVYVTGYSLCDSVMYYYNDYTTVKYNAEGVQQWAALYEGMPNMEDAVNAIAINNANNVYVTGGSVGEDGAFDVTTVKYNTSGVEQWVSRYNGSASGWEAGNDIVTDDAGNVYVAGVSGYEGNIVAVKYGISGEEEWLALSEGGCSICKVITIDNDGNVYVTGFTGSYNDNNDYITIKYNPSGEELWSATFNGPANNKDFPVAIAVDSEGNVYVTGTSGQGDGSDMATVKYDPDGNEEWVARYDGPAGVGDGAVSMVIDGDGNVYVVGESEEIAENSDFTTIKYSPSGEEQWVARYDGPGTGDDMPVAIAVDDEGSVYVTGWSGGQETGRDIATVKYSSDGVEQWTARYNSSGEVSDWACDMVIDDVGNIYVAGYNYDLINGEDFLTIKYSQETGIAEESVDVPQCQLEIDQLLPNPTISYALPSSQHISLKAYDVTGQLVQTLASGNQAAGQHSIVWDAEVSSGVYFVRLEATGYSTSAKVVVTR